MGFGNLRQWIEQLRKDKDLIIVEAPVDPKLELAEIHRRVLREEGPALLFTNVIGTPFPVAANLFGTARRVDQAFGPRPEQLIRSIKEAAEALLPPSASGLWKEKSVLYELCKLGTKNIPKEEAPVLGVCRSSEPLEPLPRISSWEESGEPCITLPLIYTESITNPRNYHLGLHWMQIHDNHSAGIYWQSHKGGNYNFPEAAASGKGLPATVFLGGPPALIAAASAPVPERLPELLLASLIMGGRLPMVKDPLGGHRIPAEAEMALSGLIPLYQQSLSGGAGRPGAKREYPLLMQVQRMWHRKDAIYPVKIIGSLRQEDHYLGEFVQRLLSPAYSLMMPSVKSLWCYPESGVQSLTAAVVRERHSREAMASAFRILGENQLRSTKFLLVTSEEVELSNFKQVLETVLARFKLTGDLLILDHLAQDSTGYIGPDMSQESKGILLGVGEPVRELPYTYDEGAITGIDEAIPFCRGCLSVSGASYVEDPQLPERLAAELSARGTAWPLVLLADSAYDMVSSQNQCLRTVFERFNPSTDLYAETEVVRHNISYKLPIVIDARIKPGDLHELIPCEDTMDKVDRKWKTYFPEN